MAGSGSIMDSLLTCMIHGLIIIQALTSTNCFFKTHQNIFQIFFIVATSINMEVFLQPKIHGGMI